MKKNIILCFILITLFSSSAISLFAEEPQQEKIQAQLKIIYSLYREDPAGSCRKLEGAIQSTDASALSLKETKEAYYFLANCTYKLKNLDKSVLYYQKVADLSPNDHQPLVDAGNVYFEQGLHAQAENKYKEALQRIDGSAPEEKKRVQAMIKNIPEKLQKNFTVSTGIGYDSNVNSGPKDTVHLLYDSFNYTLTSDEKAREDFYNNNSLTAAFSKELQPRTYLLFNFGADQTNYFKENDFNSSLFSASMGYKKLFGNKSMTVSPFVDYQIFDEVSYQISSGLNLSSAVRVSEKVNVWPTLSWYAQNFYNNDPRDAQGVSIGSSVSYTLNKMTSWINSLFFTHNKAKNDQFTYNSVFFGNSINRTISKSLTAAIGYNLQLFYYDDIDPVFGSSRRDNGHNVYLNFNYSLKKLLHMDKAFLSLNVSYNQNNSNHSFQENNRLFSALKFTVTF